MKTIHALLVGINNYPIAPLHGCINDLLAVDAFFRNHAKRSGYDYRPMYLLAPHENDKPNIKDAGVAKYDPPTRDNIVAGFQKHLGQAKGDEICFFYYSGHGSQEPAAPEFRHLKSDGMNETLVCVDSRGPGGRDLVDKELAWLLWQVTANKPDVHFLSIMDCCHSGNNTRGDDNSVRTRDLVARYDGTPFNELLGIKDMHSDAQRLFDVRDGKAYYRAEGRYVHLAAARDSETAKELSIDGRQRGAFTWSLVRVLQQGGVGLSYREVMRRTEPMVRNRVKEQIPQLDAPAPGLADQRFLGGPFQATPPEYGIVYKDGEWRLAAGSIDGLMGGTPNQPTKVRLTDGSNRETTLSNVYATYSLLDRGIFNEADRANVDLRGTVTQMAVPKINIALDPNMPKDKRDTIAATLRMGEPAFASFNAPNADAADYLVRTDNINFMLCRKGSTNALFRRMPNASDFIAACNTVGKWTYLLELHNPETKINRGDFSIETEAIEGQPVSPDTLNHLDGKKTTNPDAVLLRYKDDNIPALRCSVKANRGGLWFGGVFMDSQYGIEVYMKPRQLNAGEVHRFEFPYQSTSFNAIPLEVSDEHQKLGIGEITDYLKLYVSTDPFSLDDYQQVSLPLDNPQDRLRSAGFGKATGPVRPDWMTVTIPVKIVRPLSSGPVQQFKAASFTVKAPAGFNATAAVTSESEVRRKLAAAGETVQRGTAEADSLESLKAALLPPASLWGKAEADGQVFTRGVEAEPESAVSILELTNLQADHHLAEPLRLELDEPLADNEVIIPYGYDAESGLYVPAGFTNGDHTVEIHTLPPETPGRLTAEAAVNDRSVGGSIKLFFKKVVLREKVNTLAMHSGVTNTEVVTELTDIRAKLADPATKNVLLLVHGIFGDTLAQCDAVFKLRDFHQRFDAVLTFDYENLNTDLRKTAADLRERLEKAGLFEVKSPRLTIVAHSMGGLVSRRMIEFEPDVAPYIKHLIMCGTPNGGSDLSEFRQKMFGMLGKALNGSALLKPYLIPLAFISKKLDSALWKTLDQMHPAKSDFLPELNAPGRPNPGVRYSLIAGNTKEIFTQPAQEESFWQRLKRYATGPGVYTALDWAVFDEPNDMAVEVSSQKAAPALPASNIVELPCDHISYFCDEASLTELGKLL